MVMDDYYYLMVVYYLLIHRQCNIEGRPPSKLTSFPNASGRRRSKGSSLVATTIKTGTVITKQHGHKVIVSFSSGSPGWQSWLQILSVEAYTNVTSNLLSDSPLILVGSKQETAEIVIK